MAVTSLADNAADGAQNKQTDVHNANQPQQLQSPEQKEDVEDAASKNKKKRSKKKKAATAQDNTRLRLVGSWPAPATPQTNPATVPIDKCFTSEEQYPLGEILEYGGNGGQQRMQNAELRAAEIPSQKDYCDLRRAAEAHRQSRKFLQQFVEPGMSMMNIVQTLEAKSKELISANGLQAGWAFPTGVSINNCAAHYTPNYGEDEILLSKDDIVKIDFGVHVNGRLVDCAFSLAFDEKFDPLIQATKDATNTGLKEAGIDARFTEIGAAIEEAIKSYEIELNGKTYKIKPIENLNGHTTDRYLVHGGKSLPIVKMEMPDRMEEGEIYAIETFASTGRGKVWESGDCSHYMLNSEYADTSRHRVPQPRVPSARTVLNHIVNNFSTLAFCRRWLDDSGCKRHVLGLKALEQQGIVRAYPPLVDIEGCYTSQMEHTVILRPTCKEVVTRGPDF